MSLGKTGGIRVESAEISPAQVSPSGEIQVKVRLSEDVGFVGPFDPGLCDPPGFNATGLRVNVRIEPDWTNAITDTICVPVSNFGSNSTEETYALIAPQLPEGVGQSSNSIQFEFEKVGAQPLQASGSVSVQRDGFEAPQNGDNGNGESIADSVIDSITDNPVRSGVAVVAIGAGLSLVMN